MKKNTSLLAVLICLTMTVSLHAQSDTKSSSSQRREKMGGEKMMKLKQDYLKENFKISDKESGKFWAAYELYQREELVIHQKCKSEMERNGIVREKGRVDFEKLSDEQLLFFFDNQLETEKKLTLNKEKFHHKMKEILSPKKMAEYYQLEKNFKQELFKASDNPHHNCSPKNGSDISPK